MADMAQTFEQNNISPKTAEAFDTDVAAKLENLKVSLFLDSDLYSNFKFVLPISTT